MAQVIGTVDIREGKVFARSQDGSLRELSTGDSVFEGEVLVPSAGAVAQLVIPDMPVIALVSDREMLLSGELLSDVSNSASESAVEDATVAAVIAALEGDGDILDNLEAPAAGGARGDEGSSFVRLGRIGFDLPEFASLRGNTPIQQFTVNRAEADNDLQLLLGDEVEPAPVNQAPDAVDDTFEVAFGAGVTGNVLGNDSDPEGDSFSVSANTDPENGAVIVGEDGGFSYTPNDGFSGSDSFTYTITDGNGNADTATVIVNVGEEPEVPTPPVQNLAPDAIQDEFETGFELALTGNVLVNDSDPEDDVLTVVGNSDPSNGTVTVNEDGSFVYSPNDGFSGEDSFTYTITDTSGNTDTATVFITVGAETAPPPPPVVPVPNVGPDAIDDSGTLQEDSSLVITVLANDADPDGGVLSVTSITQPSNGTAVLNANGTVTYTPNADYNGTDSFTYTITDGQGGTDTATVNLTVNPVNDPPVSVDLAAQSNQDADAVSVDLSGSFSDIDSALTYSATGLPTGLSIDPATGVITGTIDSSASQGGTGGVYAVTITATDGVNPPVSESFDWTVSNPGPVALDDTQGAAEDTAVDITVLANDSDVDGDTLSIQSFTQPANGVVTDNGDGTLRYTPNDNYNGPDSFTYTITDGEGGTATATVNLTVDASNDPPVSLDLLPQSSQDADVVSVDVSTNFTDVDSTLTYSATGLPAGLSIDPATGVISGTIDSSASQDGIDGVYEVTVSATDGVNPPVSETFNWTVANPGPTAVDDNGGSTNEDTAATFTAADLLSNDTDPDGDDLSITGVSNPTNGTVVLNGDGTITFTPTDDYSGPASFDYSITDNEGGTSTATVNLTVDAVNDPPVVIALLAEQDNADADNVVGVDVSSAFEDVDSALTYEAAGLPAGLTIDSATGVISGTIGNSASQDGASGVYNVTITASDGVNTPVTQSFDWTVTNPGPTAVDDDGGVTNEDTAATFATADLLGNDTDPDGDDLSITGVSNPANGTVVLNGDGTITFTPTDDYNGPASFDYTITDNEGGSSTATVNLTVDAVNDPPVVIALLAEQDNADADNVVGVDVSSAFEDVDSTLEYSATGLPAGLTIDSSTGVISGTIDNSASQDGASGVYNVTVTATDGDNPPVSQTFDWTVTNPGPTAVDDNGGSTNEDTAATFTAADLLGNDTDPDADGLSITGVSNPTNGTVVLNGDGTITFTPTADYNGPASFDYSITDSEGGTSTATVNLTVDAVNDPPVVVSALNPQVNDDADSVAGIDVSTAFEDVDSTLEYSATGLPAGLTIDSVTGVISGTIDNSASQDGASGVYNVTITASDGVNTPVTQSFDWTVTNLGPTAVDDNGGSTNEDTAATFAAADLLGNDTDPDSDQLSIESVGNPANGTVVLNGDGTVTFTPTDDYNGPASFDYTITDGEGGTSTATVNLTVDDVNDPPVVIALLAEQDNVDADNVVGVDVSSAFEDVDSALTYEAAGLPVGLTIDSATGVISGTIDNSASQDGASGVYNVTITASDGVNTAVTQNFDWTVTNPGPTAVDDEVGSTNEDTAATFAAADLLGNDTDPDGDDLSITGVSNPANGTVVLNGDGTITFTPTDDYNGPASFDYTITDGEGGTSTATVNLTVDAVNDPPAVIALLAEQDNADADNVVGVDVSSAFEDVDSALTYEAAGLPVGLTIDSATGVISGTIDNSASQDGASGVYNVTITASDGVNTPVTQNFDWTVTNPGPTAVDDEVGSTNEDTAATFAAADLLGNDTDPDGDDLSITGVSNPANGTVVLNGDGTITFTPTADYNGPASFEYTITDGEGGTSTATVNLTVDAVNDPPVVISALDPQVNDDADSVVGIDVSTAFEDVDSALTYEAAGLPAGLTIDSVTGVISGTIDNSASQDGASGVYNATITASDGVNTPVTQTFDWTVTNPGPTAVDDNGGSTTEDTAAIFTAADLLGNDTDPDGDDLSITGVSNPANGTVVLNGDGTITFTPTDDYNGPASFDYTITDGEGGTSTATVNLTVDAVNDPPVVIALLAEQDNADADNVVGVDVSSAFEDVDSVLEYSATGLPAGLTIDSATGVISGTIDNSASQDGASGVYNVTITATDGVNTPVTQSFDWTVSNPGPTANDDDGGATNEDTAATFATADLLGNDSDPDGDDLTIESVANPANGTVVLNGDGTVTFTPTDDYNGSASFDYTITDSEGGTSTATVNMTVDAVNDPPVVIAALDEQSNLDADAVAAIDTSAAFNDVDSSLQYSATGLPTGLSIDPATGIISGTIDNSASQEGASGVYSVTVTATDGVNTPVSQSFDWTVTNPGPTAVDDDGGSTNEDTAATFTAADLLGNDTDPDGDDLSITGVSNPANGTVVLNGDGTVTFTPTDDYNGPASFDYTITDSEGGTSTAMVNLAVDAVNDPPVVIAALDEQTNLDADAVAAIDTSAAFNDVDSSLQYSATGLPAGLSIDPATGIISGTIDNSASQDGASGVYNVTVTATDGESPPVSQTFDWTVTNPGPTAVDDNGGSTNEDSAATFAAADLLGNDTDPDGDDLSITGVSNPTNGTVVLNGDGTVTFTPAADYNGPASFEYTITDNEGGSDTATVNLTVDAVNDPPVVISALDPQVNDDADSVVGIDVSTAFEDVDSTLEYSATGLPAGLTIDSVTGVISGTIDNSASQDSASGVYNVTITATDGVNTPVTQNFAWTVTNPGPTAVDDDGGSTNEDTAATFTVADLLGNDTDPDRDDLSITGVSNPTNGTVVLNGDGTITFTPTDDYSGPASFEYTITDNEGGSSTATVSLTVNTENDPPVALDDTYSVLENTTLTVDGNVFDGVLVNDSDIEGSLTVTTTPVTDVTNGTLQLNADGTFVYTPNANFEGTDTFTYEVSDSDGATAEATVTITVIPENDPPLAVNDSDEVLLMTESSTSGDVLINDSDPDSGPSPIEVVSPGTIAGNYGDLVLNQDGSYIYTVDPDRTEEALLGPDDGLVAYWKFDSADGSTVADDAPTGSPTNVSLNGNPLVAGKIGNAVEFDGSNRATMPNSGEINLGTFDERTVSLHFNAADTDGRQVIYEEGGGVRGLNIYLEGGELFVGGWNRQESGWDGDWISLGTVTAGEWNHVALVLDGGPTVAPNSLTGFLNGVEVGSVQGSQIWPHSGDISIGGSGGNSRYDGGGQSSAANNFSGQIDDVRVYNSVLDDQDISALSSQDGTLIETFDYQVTDGEDNSNIAQLEITLRSGAAPDAQPLAVNDSFATNENEGLNNLDVLGNDTLADNAAISSFDTTTTGGGTVTQNVDGTFHYVPADGFSGSDTFSYTLRDDDGDTSTATVTVTVNPVIPVNDPPVAADDSYNVLEDNTLSVSDAINLGVLANDSDLNGDDLTVATTPVVDVQNGTLILAADGTFTYTPDTDFVGNDSFTYEVSDGNGGTAQATVTITVDPANDPPVSTDLNAQTSDDADAVTLDVSDNFTDSDSVLTYAATGLPPGLTIDPATGIISGTVDPSASQGGPDGVYNVEVTATTDDNTPISISENFTWTISNPGPDAVADTAATIEDAAIDIDVLAGAGGVDTDPDGDTLSVDPDGFTQPANGTVSVNPDGTVRYTPNENYSGTDTFTYTVTDGQGGTDTAMVTVNVAPVADTPDLAFPSADVVVTRRSEAVEQQIGATVGDTRGDDEIQGGALEVYLADITEELDFGEVFGNAVVDVVFDVSINGSWNFDGAGVNFDDFWEVRVDGAAQARFFYNNNVVENGEPIPTGGPSGSENELTTGDNYSYGSPETNENSNINNFTHTTPVVQVQLNSEGRAVLQFAGASTSITETATINSATVQLETYTYEIPISADLADDSEVLGLVLTGVPTNSSFGSISFQDDAFTLVEQGVDTGEYLISGVSGDSFAGTLILEIQAPAGNIPVFDLALVATVQDGDSVLTETVTIEIEGEEVTGNIAPVALDLDGDGVEYLSRAEGVVFTDETSGETLDTAWVGAQDGLLVIDANQSGTVDEVKEFVFTEWSAGSQTDMQAINEVFDTNDNNKLDSGDARWVEFAVWQDANSDGVTDEGELLSLDELGIDSIDLTYTEDTVSGTAADGDVTIYGQSQVTWTDGSVSVAEDASFAIDIADVLGDDGAIALPPGDEDSEASIDRGDTASSYEPSMAGDNSSDTAALELDLLLNISRDDKPDSGIVD